MNISRNLLLSCELLAAYKLRTLLSVLGIVVGIGAVIIMVSVGKATEKRILGRIQDMGTDLIVVNAGQVTTFAGRKRQITTVTSLIPDDAAAIARQCPAVELAAAAAGKEITARWQAETVNTRLIGMGPAGYRIRNITVVSGRHFDHSESRGQRRVAVLGPTVVQNLFGDNDPIGLQIRLGRVPFEVIGMTQSKGVDINGQDQDDVVIVPLTTAMRRVLNVTHVETIYVKTHRTALLDEAEKDIRNLLRERHRLQNKPDDFTIQNQATLVETERETARVMTLLIGSVAGISLLVGGVGILAVTLLSVKERTREIGLRRAIGARRRDIGAQFLLETGLLAAAGGVAGILAGLAGSWGASAVRDFDTTISWPTVFLGFLFTLSLGVVSGIYPAMKAARLKPIEALRRE